MERIQYEVVFVSSQVRHVQQEPPRLKLANQSEIMHCLSRPLTFRLTILLELPQSQRDGILRGRDTETAERECSSKRAGLKARSSMLLNIIRQRADGSVPLLCRHSTYPEQLILRLSQRTRVRQIQLLAHEFKVNILLESSSCHMQKTDEYAAAAQSLSSKS